MDAERLDEVRCLLLADIAHGFRDRDAVIAETTDMFAGALDEVEVARVVPALYDETLAAQLAARRDWPAVTDCDRLDAAFDDLNGQGIMARHDWWCCQTCGHGAMRAEYDRVQAENPDRAPRGYAFYHNQDTETVVDGGPLFLAYGSIDGGTPVDTVEIARRVVAVLQAHGLEVSWDGTAEQRISVQLTWQRRARPPRWCE